MKKEKLPVVRQYANVRLKDGRTGAVIEIYGDQEFFDVDVGSSPADWETVYDLTREDIVEILWEPKDG